MKLVSFETAGPERAGLVMDGRVLDLAALTDGVLNLPLDVLIEQPDLMERAGEIARSAGDDPTILERHGIPLEDASLTAPVTRPGKIICLGLNYRDHAAESGMDIPSEPVVFAKLPTAVIGPGDPIVVPEASDRIDYEVELALVIGALAKGVSAADAMDCVAGFTILNDVTARDYQREKPGGQWTLAKSFDTFCPLGPWLVTPDEVGDPHSLSLECRVNGEVLQSSSTDQMIFTVPEIIEYISRVVTLEPGDVIGTGTPPGVGFARTPPRFLKSGDVVECTIERIGTLRNPVE